MHPAQLSIKDFTYTLPEEKIAKFPLAERDQSRLLVFKDRQITEDRYTGLAQHLPENALLVFNNTKVVEARILFQKATGGVIEIFTLEPDERYKDISEAMKETGRVFWKCLIGGASKWKHGQALTKRIVGNEFALDLQAKIAGRSEGSFLVEFNWTPEALSFADVLHETGLIPIPPYLKRETAESDKERYQTIYAKEKGSVAAPTAGLHFTEQLMSSLQARNISAAYVTLHVGAGTFMPVKSELMHGHQMHAEFIEVTTDFIDILIRNKGNVFPVGTTSLRSIESIYWMGVKCFLHPGIKYEALAVTQWEVYDELQAHELETGAALQALKDWMKLHTMQKLVIRTSILIAPGYPFKITRGLITNFHQPQSTLLLLVAALIGDDWKRLYQEALDRNFRFLSYGDGCLLYPV